MDTEQGGSGEEINKVTGSKDGEAGVCQQEGRCVSASGWGAGGGEVHPSDIPD